VAAPKESFVINGLEIDGSKAHGFGVSTPMPLPMYWPARAEVMKRGVNDPRRALKAYCEWLLTKRMPNGSWRTRTSMGRT
jgi:hypothetical protein